MLPFLIPDHTRKRRPYQAIPAKDKPIDADADVLHGRSQAQQRERKRGVEGFPTNGPADILLDGVVLLLGFLQHPESSGSRRVTPTSAIQRQAGQLPFERQDLGGGVGGFLPCLAWAATMIEV